MKHLLYLALLTIGLSSAFGQISFGPSRELTNYATRPFNTTAVDLDLDGDIDVITHEEDFGWVKWYLNDGVGNFSKGGEWFPPTDTTLGFWHNLGFLDYDGDGYLDILGLLQIKHDTTQAICLVRGLEGATFEEGFTKILVSEYDPQTEEGELERVEVGLQDFDGNGKKDIVFENHIVFLGDEPLTATETNVNLESFDNWNDDLPLIDWNEDGMPDLIDLSYSLELTVRLNEGRGRFSEKQIIELPSLGAGPFRNMVIDPIKRTAGEGPLEFCLSYEVNEIDYLSIITKTNIDSVSISTTIRQSELLPQDIAGSWAREIQGERVIITTYDQRGVPEIDTYQLLWDGIQLSAEPLVTSIPSFVFGGRAINSADLNGDGSSDLIVTCFGPDRVSGGATDEIFWLRDSVGGSYDSIRNTIVAPSHQQSLQAASDVNLDGLTDLITLQQRRGAVRPGSLVLWTNENNGESFSASNLPGEDTIVSVLNTFELDGSLTQLGDDFADIDWLPGGVGMMVCRNIYPDALDGEIEAFISFIFQDASGAFVLIDYVVIQYAKFDHHYYEDLNGDGVKDLIYNLSPAWWLGEDRWDAVQIRFGSIETRGFKPAFVTIDDAIIQGPPVDFDQDGDLDLHLNSLDLFNASSEFWMENEGGNFTTRREFGDGIFTNSWNSQPTITRLDLDGDGDLDQVTELYTDRIIGWNRIGWFENKEGSTQADAERSQITPFSKVRWASRDSHLLADLDNDGIKDLVVGSSFYSRLEWFKITHAAQPPAYTDWATSKGITGHSASPLADWDGDAWTNWEEFAFGSDPNQRDPNHPGRPRITINESGPALTFNRRQDAANKGMVYQYLRSPDLRSWSSWIQAEITPTPIDEAYEKVSIPLDQPKGFFLIQPMLQANEQ